MIELELEDAGAGAAVVRARGRVDMVAAGQLRSVVSEAVASGRTRLVVDLSEAPFLDSSGLGALIAGLKTARQAGGDLRLACVGEQPAMVLELTQMSSVLRPWATVEEALGAG